MKREWQALKVPAPLIQGNCPCHGTFLTWMQEKQDPVFVFATSNNISQLPPEMLRKGRFDEIFFVDLPAQKTREEILRIHLEKKDRGDLADEFDLEALAKASPGYSGAELEEAVKDALFQAFDEGRELEEHDIAALGSYVSALKNHARKHSRDAEVGEIPSAPCLGRHH